MSHIYHVSKKGNDKNDGSVSFPFLTIQQAADLALPGDTVIVHEGVYREWVRPQWGGNGHSSCITYKAADHEHVIIKGSEPIKGWELYQGTTWRVCIPNTLFGNYNPFQIPLMGDWIVAPYDTPVHLGEVYLNGKSFYESFSIEEVLHPTKREVSPYQTWGRRTEQILEPEQTLFQWYAVVSDTDTTIYANFHTYNPNEELVEINVRRSCFYPEKTGLNYITVSGFELAQAACPWAPPTADQPGLIGPNWAKGWIIENCNIHDAKCVGISLGKEASTGDNYYTRWNIKSGYHNQMESVFRAIQVGWSKEKIGSHTIRNNKIHDCGQAGIVGHMGCSFSDINHNEIYNIGVKHEFYGHEIAGIKFHAAIDVWIHDNYIHNCSLGTWLDWQAQGTRVSRNIYDKNNRDFMIEVTHGPCLVDHNIFTSPYTFDNAAQGTAFVHNLICGFHHHYPVLDRSTPYHVPHSTKVAGTSLVYGNDDRWYQNIFVGGEETDKNYGTADYNGAPTSLEEYISLVKALGHGDVQLFAKVPLPAYINGNVYLAGAKAFSSEKIHYISDFEPHVSVEERADGVYLKFCLPKDALALPTQLIDTKTLGKTYMSEEYYESSQGEEVILDYDLLNQKHTATPTPGPIQNLQDGMNEILIWSHINC